MKYAAILIVLLLVLTGCSVSSGGTSFEYEQLNFTSDDGTVTITAYPGNATLDFSANVTAPTSGCNSTFGIAWPLTGGNVTAVGCNDTLQFTSNDGEISIEGWPANNTLNFELVNDFLQNIVEDLTPQLGGNLDGQSFTITARGITSTIPNNANRVALIINQNDVTNNPVAVYIDNDGTSHGLHVNQDGILGAIQHGLYVRSTADQDTSDLVAFAMDNAGSTKNLLRLDNAGTGSSLYINQDGNGEAIYINNDGTNHGLYFTQGAELGANKHGLFVYTNVEQDVSNLVEFGVSNAGSSADAVEIDNNGMGTGLFINQDGNGTALEIDSEALNVTGIDADFQNTSGDLVQISVNNNEKYTLDYRGIWTTDDQSGFFAYKTSTQAIPDNVVTLVTWEAEGWDHQNEMNLATETFTAIEAGVYATTFTVLQQTMQDGEYVILYLYKNGACIHTDSQYACTNGQGVSFNLVCYVELAANDTLDCRILQNDGAGAANNLYGGSNGWYTFWQVSKIQ